MNIIRGEVNRAAEIYRVVLNRMNVVMVKADSVPAKIHSVVSVGEGVEGLVHVSEIAMHHVESPELELSIGQQVKVKVTEVDADRRRVSLSIKQALPEWEERSTWSERKPSKPRRREFQREDEAEAQPSFNADASLEAILQELKERGIGRS